MFQRKFYLQSMKVVFVISLIFFMVIFHRLKAVYIDDLERKLLELQYLEEAKRSVDGEAKKEREKEEWLKRKEQLLQERFDEEKLKILNHFQEEISAIHEEHKNELLQYETALNQVKSESFPCL